MPLQNRVTPFGEIIATPARGTLMGNRGNLHNAERTLGRARWRLRAWITCVLEFKGRQRTVMTPGLYTELFFLDEATALAAGHRPCFECRRADALHFRDCWLRANPAAGVGPDTRIGVLDTRLHAERVGLEGAKITFPADLGTLPDGVLIALSSRANEAHLLRRGLLWRWSPAGYTESRPAAAGDTVRVLTPRSIVRAIAAGYEPALHPSAG